jgi:uncharacterized membrane protein (UPF0136 family)
MLAACFGFCYHVFSSVHVSMDVRAVLAVLCALLAVGMGIRAVNSGKFMPAGLVTTLSLIMVAVYVKVLVSPPAKAKET